MINWPIEILPNKYSRWYECLIEKARIRGTVQGYKERHHVIPNCFIKNNDKVELTAREHYIAHLLLWKMSMSPANHNKMTMALNVMVNGSGHKKQDRSYLVNSRIYESHRKEYVAYLKEYMSGPDNKVRGRKHTPEALEKMRAWQQDPVVKQQQRERVLGEKNHFYGKTHSDEKRKQISESTKESWKNPELRERQSKNIKKRWEDPEFKKQTMEARLSSEGWLNRDWKAIGRKAADTKMASGWKPTEESKKKLSETRKAKLATGEIVPWNKGKKVGCFRTEESLKAGAKKAHETMKANGTHARLSGEKNPFYGKNHSEETKAKISATKAAKKAAGWINPNKGKPANPEGIAKMKATKAKNKNKKSNTFDLLFDTE